ncbi:MAG: putative toxin-antitoxin system toxin component, PIN family [Candidatus Riflebacteria bacterium]|nr:putative toxin-antitoxin system toxin component, PIN family [Candidatus Riflebacteria bacterium]
MPAKEAAPRLASLETGQQQERRDCRRGNAVPRSPRAHPAMLQVGTYNVISDIICRMRLVVDTNVLLSALRSPLGASYWLIRRILDRSVEAAVTVPVFFEYEAVLLRSENLDRIGWSASQMQTFLTTLLSVLVPTNVWYLWRPGYAEPADEMFVECAVASSANVLVTFNTRDYLQASRRFRFEIQTPAQTVSLLREAGVS